MQDLITPAEAAKLLGLTPASVRALERTHTLPAAIKTANGNRLFRRRDVLALVQKRKEARRGR
jgi:DNA-binding transcriptional MerR regulator